MNAAYYNENDPFAAAWLRNLIAASLIAPGDVDERSIVDFSPDDVRGYVQCHFFAGIGGWPYALDLAGWSGPVWTGSCPCQPFSTAGKRRGTADERHLWPEFHRLIAECRPATIFGEQVASKDGREWLAGVRADLEALGYAVGAADLCAAGVGAPHIRQRLFWVADAGGERAQGIKRRPGGREEPELEVSCAAGGLGDPGSARLEGRSLRNSGSADQRSPWPTGCDAFWVPCLDGKARRIEPTIQPLAHGVPNRVGLLRGAGNAIVPQAAAQFIRAYIDISHRTSNERTHSLEHR